jgi:hypothetical protein
MPQGSPAQCEAGVVTESALLALGFVRADDGTLVAPADVVVRFIPTGAFFELRISFDGNAVTAVLAKSAVKICREGAR